MKDLERELLKKLSRFKTCFEAGGSVTAGNSSQMSDGAAFVMSEEMVKELNLEPIAISKLCSGVEPRIMGIGPVKQYQKY
jgi:acetyl-CoA acyltransferase